MAAFQADLAEHPDHAPARAELRKPPITSPDALTPNRKHSQYMPARYLPSSLPVP